MSLTGQYPSAWQRRLQLQLGLANASPSLYSINPGKSQKAFHAAPNPSSVILPSSIERLFIIMRSLE